MTLKMKRPPIDGGHIDWDQLKETLIAYKGGGYSGCLWEWNYGFVNHTGFFINIVASGRKGCESAPKMEEFLIDNDSRRYYLYDVTDEDEWSEFVNNHNEGHVINITYALNNGALSRGSGTAGPSEGIDGIPSDRYELTWPCDFCGDETAYGYPAGHEGAGGTRIQATLKVCEECYFHHKCVYCGEFYRDVEDFVEGHCEYCAEEQGLDKQETK